MTRLPDEAVALGCRLLSAADAPLDDSLRVVNEEVDSERRLDAARGAQIMAEECDRVLGR